jgi:hypothetical protein
MASILVQWLVNDPGLLLTKGDISSALGHEHFDWVKSGPVKPGCSSKNYSV